MTPLNAVLRYRELLLVEDLFRRPKVQLRTRPIYHSCDAAIRGHVFCSFLALMLQKELADLCRSHEVSVEWDDLIRDLDRPQEATIEKEGKRVTTRTREVRTCLAGCWNPAKRRRPVQHALDAEVDHAGARGQRLDRWAEPLQRGRCAGRAHRYRGGLRRRDDGDRERARAAAEQCKRGERRVEPPRLGLREDRDLLAPFRPCTVQIRNRTRRSSAPRCGRQTRPVSPSPCSHSSGRPVAASQGRQWCNCCCPQADRRTALQPSAGSGRSNKLVASRSSTSRPRSLKSCQRQRKMPSVG